MEKETLHNNSEEIKYTLSKVAEDNPRGIVLFAVRSALRVLPLIADSQGSFRFKNDPQRHALAVWRGLYLSLNDVFPVSSLAKAAQAVSAAGFSAQSHKEHATAAAVNSASSAISSCESVIKHKASDLKIAVDHAVNAYEYALRSISLLGGNLQLDREMENDLGRLSLGALDNSFPLWLDENPLEHYLNTFVASCYSYDFHELVDDYRNLLVGGSASGKITEGGWDKYDALWESLVSGSFRKKEKSKPKIKPETNSQVIDETIAIGDDHGEIDIGSAVTPETSNSNDIYVAGSKHLGDGYSNVDYLNRDNSVNSIKTWLKDENNYEHIAFGLFGDWGAGKSTFLNLLKKKLTGDDPESGSGSVDFIWGEFNAWQYEHSGNIQAGLAQEAVTALKEGLNPFEKMWLTIRYAWCQHKLSFLMILMLAFFTVAFWIVGGEIFDPDDRVAGAVITTGLFSVYMFNAFKHVLAHPLAEKLKTYLRLPNFGEYLGTVPVMREHIKSLTELRLNLFKRKGVKNRFVFAIDDLDRCSPGGVVKTLEAVRLVMDLENVVVIIAIDQRIALASLSLNYKELSEHHVADPLAIARDYLSKVINSSLILGRPSDIDIDRYLEENLWKESISLKQENNDISHHDLEKKSDNEAIEDITEDVRNIVNLDVLSDKEGLEQEEISDLPPHESARDDLKESGSGQTFIGLSYEQKQIFKDWVLKLGLCNPRQLKRLNNAYALIRLCYKDEDDILQKNAGKEENISVSLSYSRLIMMLWLEFLHELPNHVRSLFIEALEHQQDPSEGDELFAQFRKSEEHWLAVKTAIPDSQIREKTYHEVKVFILPAINTSNT